MVAYSFQPRFELPIIAGTKIGTIRALGKRRHAVPGDELQLYTGMRTKRCRLIATAICVFNEPISISFKYFTVLIGVPKSTDILRLVGTDEQGIKALLDPFAREDGFGNFAEMAAFWRNVHGLSDFHHGRYIKWSPATVKVAA